MYRKISNTDQQKLDEKSWFRWWQLTCGILCMIMIANLQYAWTLFVDPIQEARGWSAATIQTALTILIAVDSWLMPFEGAVVDRFGPRIVMVISGLLVGICWVVYAFAETLPVFYFASIIGGIGVAGVYGGTIGNSLRWFPDKRGLAAGLTAAGYGAGSAATIAPVGNMIDDRGYQDAFLIWGIIQGATIIFFGAFIRAPRPEEVEHYHSTATVLPNPSIAGESEPQNGDDSQGKSKKQKKYICCDPKPILAQKSKEFGPKQVASSPLFWCNYTAFLFAATPGLIATGQLAPIAKEYGIEKSSLTIALTVDRILNGVSRPISGFLSDIFGREELLFFAFLIEGIGFFILWQFGSNRDLFIGVSAMLFFTYGEAFSLFPASMGDTFGRKYVAANYGMLYTAKGVASLLIPISDVIYDRYNSWKQVLIICAVLGVGAAIIVIGIIKPMKKRFIAAIEEEHRGITESGNGFQNQNENTEFDPENKTQNLEGIKLMGNSLDSSHDDSHEGLEKSPSFTS